MRSVQFDGWDAPAPAVTRRARLARTARFVSGFALAAALVGFGWAQPAAAQDDSDTITLTGGGATLTVSPGNADAVSTVAEAHASPGHAETIAAAARAVADCEDGALAEGAAALAVAHPDEGAATIGALASTEAKSNKDNAAPIRTVVENKCQQEEKAPPKEEKKAPKEEVVVTPPAAPEVQVVAVPVTGIGAAASQGLSSLFAAVAAVAGLGAVALRDRRGLATVRG